MEKAELVLDFIRVLIWPAVVTVALVMFRQRLGELFGRVTEVGGAGVTAKFTHEAQRIVRESAPAVSATAKPSTTSTQTDWTKLPAKVQGVAPRDWRSVVSISSLLSEGYAVDLDLSGLPADEALKMLAWANGYVEAMGGEMAADKDNPYRFGLKPPAEYGNHE